jgi:hypothetical protein
MNSVTVSIKQRALLSYVTLTFAISVWVYGGLHCMRYRRDACISTSAFLGSILR